ncbi:MAG TPA: thiamine pyrophosphate-dependent enzyme, partial [Chloroflexota bacterium]|nr:thiamine pyrophosphate-dependent enzyme [Chloroflexota bacterium]
SLTKWAARATHPTEIPRLVQEAFRQLRTGRPRPVELEIPPDVLQAAAEVTLLDPRPVTAPAADPELLEAAARLLGGARHPLIFVGGGVLASDAGEELRLLAELLEAPMIPSRNGKGALSDRHYLAQYPVSTADLVAGTDVILAVGTRFVQSVEATWPKDAAPAIIQLDIDPGEIGRNRKPTIGLAADAKLGLSGLLERVPRHNRRRESRRDALVATKLSAESRLGAVQPQAAFARAIREELPDDGIVVADSTQVGYWAHGAFPVYQPRTYLGSGYQGTLGFGFPTALGAQVGNPGRKVVSINGDGGFLFNIQELSTVAQLGINAVAVVFDDGAYGNVRRIQKESFHGHTIASELRNPDFVKLADAFGVRSARVESPEALARALREAFRADEPALIAVPVGEMPSIYSVLRARQTAGQRTPT